MYKAEIVYTVIDAEEHPELAKRHEINQAPTLVYPVSSGTEKAVGVSMIRRYIDAKEAVVHA